MNVKRYIALMVGENHGLINTEDWPGHPANYTRLPMVTASDYDALAAELARCRAANVYDGAAHRKAAEFEVALTKVHGIVAEYWGPCPGSVETLLTIRDALGTKDWRPNVDLMPRLLPQTETACESEKGCNYCGSIETNPDCPECQGIER